MLCKIADLIADVPTAGDLASRCRDYLCTDAPEPNIIILEERYRKNHYHPDLPYRTVAYMESAYQFYTELVKYNGFYLHCSAVVYDGKAYLFSGYPGAGKSTHARLWQSVFGSDVRVINDDKPALRLIDGVWYAYGTPWCGKDGINRNEKAPVAGVCFMKQAPHNAIRRLDTFEAMQMVLRQTIYKFEDTNALSFLLQHLDNFLQTIPVFELENLPEPEAAKLSYQTMRRGAEEAGL